MDWPDLVVSNDLNGSAIALTGVDVNETRLTESDMEIAYDLLLDQALERRHRERNGVRDMPRRPTTSRRC